MTIQPIDRDALQAQWRANDAELNRIVNAPSLDRIMLAKREEALLDEQDRIEFELGRDTATPFEPTKIIDQYRSVLFQLNAECTELGRAEFLAVAMRLRELWSEWQGEDSLHATTFGEPDK
jgi:hypothetical protein